VDLDRLKGGIGGRQPIVGGQGSGHERQESKVSSILYEPKEWLQQAIGKDGLEQRSEVVERTGGGDAFHGQSVESASNHRSQIDEIEHLPTCPSMVHVCEYKTNISN
jgi:hypothetical protein